MRIYKKVCVALLAFGLSFTGFAQSGEQGSQEKQVHQQNQRQQKETLPATPEETYKDIEETLGFVPEFFRKYPKEGITGAWIEMKQLEMGKTNINAKNKQLLSLAVAAQVPCDYCVQFHSSLAKAHGASEAEIKEAVALAGGVRHWSTFLNGADIDKKQFDADVEKLVQHIKEQQKLAE